MMSTQGIFSREHPYYHLARENFPDNQWLCEINKMTRRYSYIVIFIVTVLPSLSSGCAAIQRHWPNNTQLKNSAVRAIRHPGTWVPVAGALTIALGDWDQEISDWAREETPVFGSKQSAQENSDRFRSFAHYGMILSALAVNSDSEGYWLPMIERLAWEHVGALAATTVRIPIKKIIDRNRPNGGTEGFPSGHATRAFSYVGMTYRNIDALNLNPVWEYSAKSIETGFGYSTAWARVEAGEHYPTDVLAGAALGNFVALFIYDAFFDKDYNTDVHVMLDGEGGVVLSLQHSF